MMYVNIYICMQVNGNEKQQQEKPAETREMLK